MEKTDNENLVICSHPLCQHNLSIIRDKKTSAEVFRNAVKRITYLLFYAATEDLELECVDVETPLQKCESKILKRDKNIIIAPILRAGLIFSSIAAEIMPHVSIQHIGMYRDEKTLQPIWYYNKIPIEIENPENNIILILDPMLATGNSAIEAIKLFVNKKIPQKNIKFVNLISAPEGLKKVHDVYPDVKIITAHVDNSLNNNGYILPGLGDAGDRIFNTLED
ncbi:MAG: uracil phosphoribosyltransferase [Candidatus Gastranaerophilales bacterium]|nr:uracil phosphoribosyltransferase [Candidatus Gastranaerophilales bacterium]